jgi:SAM-dependent methyltransferase
MTATVFDRAAAAYDRLRPAYPAAVYDAIARLSGIPLTGASVVEVGAGTGIATRGLRARGAHVVAVDLSLAMLRVQGVQGVQGVQDAQDAQDVTADRVVARGERLPLRDGVVDLVCAATAWHWVEAAAGVAEAVRVLRRGGALALWWNTLANRDASWVRAREDALRQRGTSWTGCYADDHALTELDADLLATRRFAAVERQDTRWERTVPIAAHLAELATHSPVIRLGAGIDDYLAEQRFVLEREFSDGLIREQYLCHLHVARVPP